LKREIPIKGRRTAEPIDRTLKILKKVGNRDAVAANHRAMPNAIRIADAAHRPLWVCHPDTNLTIAAGDVSPKTPIPAVKRATAITISSLKFKSASRCRGAESFVDILVIEFPAVERGLSRWN
jgi:hypothetical protein